jgi:hypothetical protein
VKTTQKKRNILFLTAVPAITLVLGFMWAGCSNPAGGSGPQSVTYRGTAYPDGTYELTITEPRAVHAPGGSYVLTINPGNKTSRGKVDNFDSDTGVLKLLPEGGGTFTVEVSGGKIREISGEITLVGGDKVQPPTGVLSFDGRYVDGGGTNSDPLAFNEIVITGTDWVMRLLHDGYEKRVEAEGTLTVTGPNTAATEGLFLDSTSEKLTVPITGIMTLSGGVLTGEITGNFGGSGATTQTGTFTKNPDLGFDGTYVSGDYALGIVGKAFTFYDNGQLSGAGILTKTGADTISITIRSRTQGADLFTGTGTFRGSTLTLTGTNTGGVPTTYTKQ